MFNLLDFLTGGKERKELAGKKAAAAQLSFDDVIEAHERWKERLLSIVEGTSQELTSLDIENVRRDDKCALGGWIHGIAKDKFSKDGNYLELRDEHARFHICAADVIEHVEKRRPAYTKTIIEGEFSRRSRKVVGLLEILRGKYGKR
jgi:hypothetical protein